MIKNKFILIVICSLTIICGIVLTLIQILKTDISPTVITENPTFNISQYDKDYFEKGDKIAGSIIASQNNLGIVLIPLKETGVVYTGKIIFRIRETSSNNWYFESVFDSSLVSGLNHYLFGFPVLQNSKNKVYEFEIEAIEGTGIQTVDFDLENRNILLKYQYPKNTFIQQPMNVFPYLMNKIVSAYSFHNLVIPTVLNFIPFIIFLLFISCRFLPLGYWLTCYRKISKKKIFKSNIYVEELIVCILLNLIAGYIIFGSFLHYKKLFIQHYTDFFLNLWPNYVHISSFIKNFEFPIWSFSVGLGTNVFAGNFMRVSLVDPFTWLTFFVKETHLILLIPYLLLLKITIAGTLFYIYLRSYKLTHITALTFSIAYAISGQMIIRSPWYHYTTEMVFLPLLLISLDQLVKNKKMWPTILCFMWLGSYHIYHILLYGIFSVFYVSWQTFLLDSASKLFNKKVIQNTLLSNIKLLQSSIIGLFIAAPLFFPNLYNYFHSARWVSRNIEQLDNFYVINSLFVDTQLFLLILLKFFGNGITGFLDNYSGWANSLEDPTFYTGLLSLIFLISFPFYFRKKRKFFLLTIAIIACYLFIPVIRNIWNGFYANRFKTSTFFISSVTLLLASMSFDVFLQKRDYDKILIKIIVILLILLFTLSALVEFIFPTIPIHINYIVLITMIVVLISFIFFISRKVKNVGIILIMLSTITMVYLNTLLIQKGPWVNFNYYQGYVAKTESVTAALDYLKTIDNGFYRINNRVPIFDSGINDQSALGYMGTKTYQSFNEASFYIFTNFWDPDNKTELGNRYFNGFSEGKEYMNDLLTQKYILTSDELDSEKNFSKIKTISTINIYQNNDVLPFGKVFNNIIPDENIDNFSEKDYPDVVKKALIVEKKVNTDFVDVNHIHNLDELTSAQVPDKYLDVTYLSNTEIKGNVTVDKTGIILFQFPFNSGWSLKVNGRDQQLFKVNKGLTGALLKPGINELILEYHQPYFFHGILISGTTCILLLYLYKNTKRNKL